MIRRTVHGALSLFVDTPSMIHLPLVLRKVPLLTLSIAAATCFATAVCTAHESPPTHDLEPGDFQMQQQSQVLSGSQSSNSALTRYVDNLLPRLQQNCAKQPALEGSTHFQFSIDRSGNVQDIVVTTPTNVTASTAVEAAKHCITSLGTVEPPPDGSPKPFRVEGFLSHTMDDTTLGLSDPSFYAQFMEQVQRQVKARWHPPKQDRSLRAVALFKVWRDGHVSDVRTQRTSGSARLDEAAVDTIKGAAPYPLLPDGAPAHVYVQMDLDYLISRPVPTYTVPTALNRKPRITASNLHNAEYADRVERSIRKYWMPMQAKPQPCIVTFKIKRNGWTSDVRISQASGSSFFDSSAVHAVDRAAPFDSLPADAPDLVDFEVTF